jgi:hypothetical protein
MVSLPTPPPRRKLHTRTIVCEGFQREDGLFDIEARLVDAKTFAFDHPMRGHVAAGSPVHDMQLRLTVDRSKTVRDIAVVTNAAPYAACSTVYDTFRKLIGASLIKGWRRTAVEAVGGTDSCTHIRELLLPAATVAFQTMTDQSAIVEARASSGTESPIKPHFVDKCKGWAADGDAVRRLLPGFYTGSDPITKPDPADA